MDFNSNLLKERSINELKLAKIIYALSDDSKTQNKLGILEDETYYSAAISHSYYSMFFLLKGYIFLRGHKTSPPNEHKKIYEIFKRYVEEGEIDLDLFRVYEKTLIKADALLNIFKVEKNKRGLFTYKKLPQANRKPAKESIENAEFFFSHLFNIMDNYLSK